MSEFQIYSTKDYYSFGMQMSGRGKTSSSEYRYGFNSQEKDVEVKGNGNSLDFDARIYDPRLGRWLSTDPFSSKFPAISPYTFVLDNPIRYKDMGGKWPGDCNVLLVIDAANPTSSLQNGGWIVIYAKNAQAAAEIMGKAFKPGQIDNLVIGSHGTGADGTPGMYVNKKNYLYIDEPTLAAVNNGESPPAASESQSEDKAVNTRALQSIAQYLASDATVVVTACGAGGDDDNGFIEELAKTLEGKDKSKKLTLLLSSDDTRHTGTKTNLGRPPYNVPLTSRYDKGFKKYHNGVIKPLRDVILQFNNPAESNIIEEVPYSTDTNPGGMNKKIESLTPKFTPDGINWQQSKKSVPSFL